MIKLLFTIFLAYSILEAKINIDTQIKTTSSKIDSYEKTHRDINKKMDENAKEIFKHQKEIEQQQAHLKKLQDELLEKESSYDANIAQLEELKNAKTTLKDNADRLEEDLVFTIAQSVSLSIILEEEYTANQDSLIEYEVLELMLKNSREKVKELNEKFNDTSKNIDLLKERTSALEIAIASIDAKRKDVIKTQKANKESLKKLTIAKALYKKELENILNKQDTLKRTLSELNIIKIDEIKKSQEAAERAEAFDSKWVVSDKNLPNVKKHGSSYQAVKTKAYVGEKTIAPFEQYEVTKKYGTYTDPIYGIKVFNESISLKPIQNDAKVKTVFNGKVIYADKTAVLDNIVIIEHDNGLHTIYANLAQIAPNIRKGVKIKKGHVIGRVNNELIFEVTQKSYHINPIGLFE